ncbi:MAG: hypothetical protein WBM86_21335 [Waterburya sp.]
MIEIHSEPEQHLEDVEYAESELLIFKYDVEGKQILLCLDDLSEKIPEWVSDEKKVGYFFRYKIFYFNQVSSFHRFKIEAEQYSRLPNDYYIVRENLAIPILDINIRKQEVGYKVHLSFDRGFGIADFYCEEIKIYELPFYYKNWLAGKNYYYVDLKTKKHFDEEKFLADLYEGKALIN